jgi:hypothetical protein
MFFKPFIAIACTGFVVATSAQAQEFPTDDALRQHGWEDNRVARLLTRAAVVPTSIANATALAATSMAFLQSMQPASAGAELLGRGLTLSFDRAAAISLPTLTPTEATFIAETAPIPNQQYSSAPGALLKPCKLASLITLTHEMMSSSNAETLCRQAMIESAAPGLDRVLFDDQPAVAGLRPAGLRNGVAALTPAAVGVKDQAIVDDIVALATAVAARAGNGQIAIVAAPAQAVALALRSSRAIPYSLSASSVLPAGMVIAVALPCLVSVLDTPRVEASQQALVHMADPAAAIATGGTISAPVASMWQIDSVSLRMTLPVTWGLRASGGVAWMSGVSW